MIVKKAAGALGAFVSDINLEELVADPDGFAALRAAAVEHEVLFFREQALEAEVLARLARCFGEILPHDAYPTVAGADDVQVLESTAERPSKIEVWHSDMTFSAEPPSFTLLHGQIIPAYGGDTLWASATAAYEALSQPLRELFAGLTAVHDFRHGFQESLAEPGGAQRLAGSVAAHPPVEHPLIRTHPETGRRAIYVNALFTTRIKELSRYESDELLRFLYQHVVTEEFTVRLNWAPYTLAVWDNRSTQHKPVNDFFPQHRLMHRVTICGDRPA